MSIQTAKRRLLLRGFCGLLGIALCTSFASADLYRWYKLDDGEGDMAFDSSPNAEHGEIYDAEWVVDEERGMTVLEFDGEISSVDGGFLPLMDLENSFTWAFWASQDELQNSPANDIIIGNRVGEGGGDTSPREFIKFTPNRFEYHMNGGFDNDMTYGFDDPEHIFDDGWLHHAVVKSGESLTYYRDGEFFNDHELLDPMFSEDPLPFWLGGQFGLGAGEHWAGRLSDVRLYDHALTEADVKAVMAGEGDGPDGDIDGDGDCDAADIDALAAAIRAGESDAKFDLDQNGSVDAADRVSLVKDFKNTWIGDSNLDGEFNSSDFVVVFGAAKYETGTPAGWAEGDWNGDGEFNSSDFVASFSDGGYELGLRPAAVPEPNALMLLLIGIAAIARIRR